MKQTVTSQDSRGEHPKVATKSVVVTEELKPLMPTTVADCEKLMAECKAKMVELEAIAKAEELEFAGERTKLAIEIAGAVADLVKGYKQRLAEVKAECCLVTWNQDTFDYEVKLLKPSKKASGKRQPNDGKVRRYSMRTEALLVVYGTHSSGVDGKTWNELWQARTTAKDRKNFSYSGARLKLIAIDQKQATPLGSWQEQS